MDMEQEKEPLLARGGGRREKTDGTVKKDLPAVSSGSRSRGARFNFLFFKRFLFVLKAAVPSICSKPMLLLLTLVLVRAAEEYNYYQVGVLPSQFYAALTGKDLSGFKDILWKMVIIVVSLCICKSGGEFIAGLVHVKWREGITKSLHSQYFSHRVYYQLNVTTSLVDNPDQRITQDVNRFCEETSQALPKLILQPFLIAYYSYRTFTSLGWFGVLGIYGFFVMSTIVNKFIMSPIVSYVFLQEKREGDYRFQHVQVRSNAESVGFYQGGGLEGKEANRRLKLLLQAQLGSVHWQLPLNFAVFMFDYVSTIISYSLVGVAIFSGKYDDLTPVELASAVSKNSFFSMYLLNSFSSVVDTAVKFAEIAGYTHRIGELLEVLKQIHKKRREEEEVEEAMGRPRELVTAVGSSGDDRGFTGPASFSSTSAINHGTQVSLVPPQCVDLAAVLEEASIAAPGEVCPLIEGLSLEFRKGKNILIMGETGTGKSSILRVLAKLWRPSSGRAQLCVPNSLHYAMFLPQRPHLTSGTLAEQVAFPEQIKDTSDLEAPDYKVNECLALTGLVTLRDRLGGVHAPVAGNWYDVVTPGEAQRVSFARIFYHMPPFVFLDEATAALSENAEECMYSKMIDLGMTFMSIGQRSSLKKFHHQLLTIKTDHSWTLSSNIISP